MTTNNLPATRGFSGGVSIANVDLSSFRNSLATAKQMVGTGQGQQFLRMTRAGVWCFGQEAVEVQDGSEWAVNPLSMEMGFIAWSATGGKPAGKVMRSILQPPVLRSELPHVASEWQENIIFGLRCLNGEDAGLELMFEASSRGARDAFTGLCDLLRAQIDLDPDRLIPVVSLQSSNYRHPSYGQIFTPDFQVLRWVAEDELPELPTHAAPAEQVAAPAPAVAAPARAARPAPAPAARPAAAPRGRAAAPAAEAVAEPTPAATTRRRRAAA